MVDQVKVVADDQAPAEQSLRRNLTNRHIQLIAIGGAIGTGLFMGSGKTISLAGPSIIFVTSLPIYSGRGQDISPAGLTGSAGL